MSQARKALRLRAEVPADVPHTPLPLSFAILEADGRAKLFIDQRKLAPETRAHLGNEVAIERPEALGPALDVLGGAGAKVLADPTSAAAWVFDRLAAGKAKIVPADDPVQLIKACKNTVEVDAAHARSNLRLIEHLEDHDDIQRVTANFEIPDEVFAEAASA